MRLKNGGFENSWQTLKFVREGKAIDDTEVSLLIVQGHLLSPII
ncbi:hypothetical protein DOT_3935 [Desulfosporosinus sp. OT]|nr:hypothetical protein DOT_3935 [Desulfosporosinus sp. OT]